MKTDASWRKSGYERLESEIRIGEQLAARLESYSETFWPTSDEIHGEAFDWCESVAFAIWFSSDGSFRTQLEHLGHSPADLRNDWRRWPARPLAVIADVRLHLQLAKDCLKSLLSRNNSDALEFEVLWNITQNTTDSLNLANMLSAFPQDEVFQTVMRLKNLGAIVAHASLNTLVITSEGWEFLRQISIGKNMIPPAEIEDSLQRFRLDHPSARKAAFVIMRFTNARPFIKVLDIIRATLARHEIVAVRADDKEYHEDLFYNVMTYMHGCAFGIAVFDRIDTDDFNPNVSLEVGYMMAMRKPVCLLKDKTLRTLHTDLVGKLYRGFDPHDVNGTLPTQLGAWLSDRGFC